MAAHYQCKSYTFKQGDSHTICCKVSSVINSGSWGGVFGRTNALSAEIPEGITKIGNYCFQFSDISSVTIPSTVSEIGDQAFCFCNSLESITILATTPPTLGGGVFGNNKSGRKIYVPYESVDAYKAAEGWSAYAADIEAIQS